ncbi:hypothetical protein N7445_000076 [Penicillium cf. griseofulvum]|nr:hypothetical protein N7445_000076 [Penicillium cf. griseofulvum]
MKRVHLRHPILALDDAQRRRRKSIAEEKHRLLFNASRHVLQKLHLRFNVSQHAIEELDCHGKLASNWLSIPEIEASYLPDVLRVRDFYVHTTEDWFQIPLKFLTMLDVVAGQAYRDGNFPLGLELLRISNNIFRHYWSDVTGEEKDEERASTKFLHACIYIAVQNFDMALNIIEEAKGQYLDQRVKFRCDVQYKDREWLLWACMAKALDGKGCYEMAEEHYRKALKLKPL